MTAKEQNKLVGIFLMAHGGFQAVMMIFIGLIYGIIGAGIFASARRQEEQMIGAVFVGMVVLLAVISMVFVIPQFVGGWKIFKESPNARTWGIIGSIVACLSFPLGTAAGVFGLVFLFGEEGKRFYLSGNNFESTNISFQPPPNSWQ